MDENNIRGEWDRFLQEERARQDSIDFKRVYVDMTGDVLAGLMLSQIIYWHLSGKDGRPKLRVVKSGRPCLVKARGDWWDEIRLSPRQADRALGILKNRGIVITENHLFMSRHMTHIFLQVPVFLNLYREALGVDGSAPHQSVISEVTIS
jgi:hypothetical protein